MNWFGDTLRFDIEGERAVNAGDFIVRAAQHLETFLVMLERERPGTTAAWFRSLSGSGAVLEAVARALDRRTIRLMVEERYLQDFQGHLVSPMICAQFGAAVRLELNHLAAFGCGGRDCD